MMGGREIETNLSTASRLGCQFKIDIRGKGGGNLNPIAAFSIRSSLFNPLHASNTQFFPFPLPSSV